MSDQKVLHPDGTTKKLEDWLNLQDSERGDLIDGRIYLQSAPSKEHSFIQSDLRAVLQPLRTKSKHPDTTDSWRFATEVGVIYPTDCKGEQACTHDLAGWKSSRMKSLDSGTHIRLRPDWVCEIVSSNWQNDTIKKRALLERNHVPYYWLISPQNKNISVLILDEKGNYSIDKEYSSVMGLVRIEPFQEIEIDLGSVFDY